MLRKTTTKALLAATSTYHSSPFDEKRRPVRTGSVDQPRRDRESHHAAADDEVVDRGAGCAKGVAGAQDRCVRHERVGVDEAESYKLKPML